MKQATDHRPPYGAIALPNAFSRWFANARKVAAPAPARIAGQGLRRPFGVLLIARLGAGKTLAGFLPSLVDLAQTQTEARRRGLSGCPHALHYRQLKALAVDIERTSAKARGSRRWGWTSRWRREPATRRPTKRQRQKLVPPRHPVTTPEQLALLTGQQGCRALLRGAEACGAGRAALAGHLQAWPPARVGLARAAALCAQMRAIGLSATGPPNLRNCAAGWSPGRHPADGGCRGGHRVGQARDHHSRFPGGTCP